MFVSKKRFEELEKEVKRLNEVLSTVEGGYSRIYDDLRHGDLLSISNLFKDIKPYPIVSRFKALLDHLNLEYQEKTETKSGYVKRGKK